MDEERREDIFGQDEEQNTPLNTERGIPDMEEIKVEEVNSSEPEPVQFVNAEQVETEPPKSQYPPYVGANQQTYQRPPQYNGYTNPYYAQQTFEQPKKKKKNVGLIIFFSILAAVILISVTAIVGVMVGKNLGNKLGGISGTQATENSENTTTNDGPELEIEDNGKVSDDGSDVEIKDGQVLTATQIAGKADKISVGVLVYSNSTKSLSGEGTGILMALDDSKKYTYVITCAHVVSDSSISITVQTNDGQTFDAEAVGVDTRTDIAVLRIKTNKLECATFGNSDNLKVGDTVYAIGNPGGTEFSGSFTSGIISALDRPVSSDIGYSMKCIQHTAAINPGNSGGALLNSYGQVIGINSSKIVAAEFEGMGFSIPISDAKEIVDKLIKYGRVPDRAKLGISYYTASSSEQYSMLIQLKGLPAGSLIIGKISSDSDLANKDIELYDVITAVDGKKLTTSDILLEKIENGKIGDELTLTIARFDNNYNMETFDVKVKLVEDAGTTEAVEEEPTTNYEYYYNPFG